MRVRPLLLALSVAACQTGDPSADAPSPNAGLLRDFTADDGKFDSSGTPLNARVTEAERRCFRRGRDIAGVFTVSPAAGPGEICRGALDGGAQRGRMVVDVRLRATPTDRARPIATFRVWGSRGVLATQVLTPRAVRGDGWMSFPVVYRNLSDERVDLAVEYHGNGELELDAFEVFPRELDLAISPGSGEYAAGDWLTFELGLDEGALTVRANGADVTARLAAGFEETSEYRRLVHVPVDELLEGIPGAAEVEARTARGAARVQVRREPPACAFAGDGARKILVTAFQPFPADAWHENISSVALAA